MKLFSKLPNVTLSRDYDVVRESMCSNSLGAWGTVLRRFVASLKNISNLLYFKFCDLNSLFHPYNLSRYLEIDIYTNYHRV